MLMKHENLLAYSLNVFELCDPPQQTSSLHYVSKLQCCCEVMQCLVFKLVYT